jgi:hypothetical protein
MSTQPAVTRSTRAAERTGATHHVGPDEVLGVPMLPPSCLAMVGDSLPSPWPELNSSW